MKMVFFPLTGHAEPDLCMNVEGRPAGPAEAAAAAAQSAGEARDPPACLSLIPCAHVKAIVSEPPVCEPQAVFTLHAGVPVLLKFVCNASHVD